LLLALALVVQRVSRMLYGRCRARRRVDQPEELRTPVFTPASTSSARWQATSRPGRTSRSVGTSVAQRSMASGQRGRKTQPGGGLAGSGGSPGSPRGGGRAAMSIAGPAERRAWVYG